MYIYLYTYVYLQRERHLLWCSEDLASARAAFSSTAMLDICSEPSTYMSSVAIVRSTETP